MKNFLSKDKFSAMVLLTYLIIAIGFVFPSKVWAEGASRVNSDKGQSTSAGGYGTDQGKLDYTPMEEIPGQVTTGDFPTYITGIYKFGIWTVGIAALLMITLGGFMYVTSAGNNASMGKAKGVITDAVIGLIMALTAWLLLNTINPDLLKIKTLSSTSGTKSSSGTGTGASSSDNVGTGTTSPTDTSTAALPKNCNAQEWQDIFNQAASESGTDKCIIQATAAKESSCTKIPSRTNSGRDCSVAQVAAQENCGTTCDDLEQNPKKALVCAANYYKKCSSKWRNSPEAQKIQDMYAGYNGGCGALNASNSCAGKTNSFGNSYQKWDCPVDCGGYCAVPSRTQTFLNYYNSCKGS